MAPTAASYLRIDPGQLIEEETLPNYRADRYYPVHIGQVFDSRYRVVGKLGYGTASTVWLCRDSHAEKTTYRAVKVYVNSLKHHRELPIYKHINGVDSVHGGQVDVRKMFEAFTICGPYGEHICLVHEPCGISLGELKSRAKGKRLDADLLRQGLRNVLSGLQYLHEEAKVIHTARKQLYLVAIWGVANLAFSDLHPDNILMGIHEQRDASVLPEIEKSEEESPAPRKELPDRIIYQSYRMPLTNGLPVISDLGEARLAGDKPHHGLVMPSVYRAPEVILGMSWSYPIDIWSFGMMAWDLSEPRRLFRVQDSQGRYSEEHHLAQMVALLGPPSLEFLERSENSWKYWNRDGTWKSHVPIPGDITLEAAEQRLEAEEKQLFLTWLRKMLQWRPEDRASSQDVFFDEWLCADLLASGEVTTTYYTTQHELATRAFTTSTKAALKFNIPGGEKFLKAQIKKQNPDSDPEKLWDGVKNVEAHAEDKYGEKAAYVQPQGSTAHTSGTDPTETRNWITLSVHTEGGGRLASYHVFEDGTFTPKETRAGGGKK
ncbi:hypothetical protein LTR17_020014 [Elasticomyces elasticus]|nr:hypothetical protein LTR17_020014 [Elasticomyces elasticus]